MRTEAKPLPHSAPGSKPYWDAAAAITLKLQRCLQCGTIRHYPQLVCANCYSLEVEWIEASGSGTVHSWTVAHHAFYPSFKGDLPYTLVIVDLKEGPDVIRVVIEAGAKILGTSTLISRHDRFL